MILVPLLAAATTDGRQSDKIAATGIKVIDGDRLSARNLAGASGCF